MIASTTKRFPLYNPYSGAINANTIIFPQPFLPGISDLCVIYDNESSGWLISRKQIIGVNIGYLVEYVFITNTGTNSYVRPTKKLNLPDGFAAIEFHTHTVATGKYWHDQFSPMDYDTLAKRVKEDSQYKHILFTPTNVLTFGKEQPDYITPNPNEFSNDVFLERIKYWESIVDKDADNKLFVR